MASKFGMDYAKRSAKCRKCQSNLLKGDLRMWRMVPNPFTADSGNPTEMKQYFHSECLFETLTRCRATTKVIESSDDIEGWDVANEIDKENILQKIECLSELRQKKFGDKVKNSSSSSPQKGHPKRVVSKDTSASIIKKKVKGKDSVGSDGSNTNNFESGTVPDDSSRGRCGVQKNEGSKFDMFKLFCKLCDVIASVSKYTEKTAAVKMFVNKEGYDGDLYLLLKFLVPVADKRVYNVKAKQIIKVFSNLFNWSVEELTESYNETGDVSQTVYSFLSKSAGRKKSRLTNQMVDDWLEKMSELTREEEQQSHFSEICKLATYLELKYIIRLIMKDLRMNAGAKHMLEGIREGAYQMFQNSRDLKAVIEKCQKADKQKLLVLDSSIVLNTPVKPMLAESCRSVEQAMNRCEKEMYAEIKYDGERLQLHKDGDNFNFFSRSLKRTMDHKIVDMNRAVAEAFPMSRNLIVDAEMLLVDTNSGKPLPFGTLGIHKKKQFSDATVCLFVFDCLYYDNKSLMKKTLRERRKFLENNMKEVPNRVLLSSCHLVKKDEHEKLRMLIWKAIDEGLEGLVLKDLDAVYEPGKRHWLKIKKDYLEEGAMADTADLIVLGAYYGTGNKGGMMSVFLMGVYDEKNRKFCTVTKCGNGHDDVTLVRINKELAPKMQKISRIFENLPKWIECSRSLVPDFIAINPEKSPVWEITGAEFSRSDNHTASGISIRFPRVTKIRDDKNWKTATSLQELKKLYKLSKTKTDIRPKIDDGVLLYAKDKLNNPKDNDSALIARKRKRKALDGKSEDDEAAISNGDSDIDTKKAKIGRKLVSRS